MSPVEQVHPRSAITTPTILILLFSLWACGYIWNTSFAIEGQRYFCLFDDAMVSMRYAHNLALGEGLAWNAGGERVEGFTNPLWVLVMALVHLSGVPMAWASLAIQLLGLTLLAGSMGCLFRIALLATGSTVCASGSALLAAFYLPLATWSLQGMEVSLQAFLIYFAALHLIKASLSEAPVPKIFYGLLACGILVRMDMILPCGALLLCALCYFPKERQSILIRGGVSILLVLAGLTLFRWWYFGELLPNTFYLKSCGIPFSTKLCRGLLVTQDFIENMGWILFAVPLFFLLCSCRSPAFTIPGLIFPIQLLYSILAGGDAWEWWGHYANRYVCVGMPGFFLLLAGALHRMMRPWNPGPEEQSKSRIPARIGFIGMLFITWLAVHGVATLEGCRAFLQQMTFRTLPLHVADNAANVAAAVWLKRATPPETVLAVHWAGALPYFYERKCIDLLGKNDRVIAHLPSRMTDAHAWIPGHDRWDYNYSLGELNPPVVVSTTPPRPFEEYGYRLVDQVNNFFILASGKNPDIQKDLEAGSPRASELYREFASRNESRIRGYLPRLTLSSLEQGLEPWLNPGEALMDATILVRDVYVFTSQRLLLLDRQKILDRNYEMVSIPFADILDFTIEETHRDDFTTRLKITLADQKEPWIKDIRRHETAAEIFQKLNRFIHKQG